jgi:hypothetical protein
VTRRDYVLIADALRNAKPATLHTVVRHSDHIAHTAWLASCYGIAHAIRRTNPKFDADRFLLACGVLTHSDVIMRECEREDIRRCEGGK